MSTLDHSLDNFLDHVNHNNIINIYFQNEQTLANQSRNLNLSGKDLVKQTVERKAHQLHMHSQHLVILATDHIWNSLTLFQRNQFTKLANNANNNARIYRITIPQVTNDPLVHNFFNGSFFP
jgi:hypothetical protein